MSDVTLVVCLAVIGWYAVHAFVWVIKTIREEEYNEDNTWLDP